MMVNEEAKAWLKVSEKARKLKGACSKMALRAATEQDAWHSYREWLKRKFNLRED